MKHAVLFLLMVCLQSGCAALYGYDIHAQGALSQTYLDDAPQFNARMGLYMPDNLVEFVSDDKGNWYSDPQTYHVGEGLMPMLIEAFQHSAVEFVLFESEPTAETLEKYGVSLLAVVDITLFDNVKTFPGQTLIVVTETSLYDSKLRLLRRFDSRGTSQASKVFNKKGGPEINLNAALENNVKATMLYISDYLNSAPGAQI